MGRTLLLASLFAIVPACAPPPAQRPYPPPTAGELLAALRARADQVQTLRAIAKVDETAAGQRVKVKVALFAARAGKLRIEADSPLGGAIAVLTSDGDHFALLDARNNRFLTGPANACNVARLIRITLAPEDVVTVLMGAAPIHGEPVRVEWDATHGGREVLTLRDDDGSGERLYFAARERRWDLLAAERRDARGHLQWRVTHEDFGDHAGIRLPNLITVQEPPHHASAQIKYRSLEPNAQFPDRLFQQEPPSGIAVEPATCEAQ
jgi:outer membrane lipoprotein-sorting protein